MVDCAYCGKELHRRDGIVADDGYLYHPQCLKKFDINQYNMYCKEVDIMHETIAQLSKLKGKVCKMGVHCRHCNFFTKLAGKDSCAINDFVETIYADLGDKI